MNWKLLLCLAVANWMSVYSRDIAQLRKLLESIQRKLSDKSQGVLRQLDNQEEDISTVTEPNDIDDDIEVVPRDEPTPPGHSLIKPSSDTLESAAKYPHKDVSGSLVYGNLNNLGITYGKTRDRVLYSGFRRSNNVWEDLLRKIQKAYKPRYRRYPVIIILRKNPYPYQTLVNSAGYNKDSFYAYESDGTQFFTNDEDSVAENDAREMLDIDLESSESDESLMMTRRRGKKHKSRQPYYASETEVNVTHSSSESESSSNDESSDYEKNPGNPYTVHKNRYKQNWLWNFAMTGDHMNVNPKAPQFNSLGPTGSDLFFGRKWWYYNQDDYIPFR
ncbi:uncharacterized protein [Choristoneura fumiferana]|uniref:uncharacterized protein n=1 Tax=Choristoneura fumiferana TaxID=7141 RepID=UPI003D15BAEE